MRRLAAFLAGAALVAGMAVMPPVSEAYEAICGPLGVLHYQKEKSYGGYVLYTNHLGGTKTYLIDLEGNVVHEWDHGRQAFMAELLPNGHLLRAEQGPGSPVTFGGWHGTLREYDWDGNVVWEYTIRDENKVAHHGFDRLPNGNTAMLIWEKMSWDEMIAKGRDPKDPTIYKDGFKYPDGKVLEGVWPDAIIEVDPSGKIVWEFHVKDHMGTAKDQWDPNYHLPFGYMPAYFAGPDWTHWNSVRYNPKTDQYLVNSRDWGEMYIIDRKTKKMVWRWGNPYAYGAGTKEQGYARNGDQILFGSHDCNWLPNGNLSIFDNGTMRPSGNHSAAYEIERDGTFNGGKIVWSFKTKDQNSFYSDYQSSAQKLPNGNWQITATNNGHVFEVTPEGEVVWEFLNPMSGDEPYCVKKDNNPWTQIHRAFRYAADSPQLKGRTLKPIRKLAPGCPDWKTLLDYKPSPNGGRPPKVENAPVSDQKGYDYAAPAKK